MMMNNDFQKEVFTSTDSGTFTPTHGRYKKKRKDGIDHLKRFLNDGTPAMKLNSKSIVNLMNWIKSEMRKDDVIEEMKNKKRKRDEQEQTEQDTAEEVPFTDIVSLIEPILKNE